MASTYSDRIEPCFSRTKHTFPILNFLPSKTKRTFSNCLSHCNPAYGWPYKFRSGSTTGSSMFAHDFGHLWRGRRIHVSGHSDLGFLSSLWASSNFTWVKADTASAANPSQPGNLAITSMIFAAVIWDASEPCSSETVKAPESSFTMSPRSTTLPLYFRNCGSKWHMPLRAAKVDFLLVSSCFQNNLLFALDLTKLHARIVSNFVHSLSTAAFASGFFIACGIGICARL